jgi:flagellar biosynthesis protein FliP
MIPPADVLMAAILLCNKYLMGGVIKKIYHNRMAIFFNKKDRHSVMIDFFYNATHQIFIAQQNGRH